MRNEHILIIRFSAIGDVAMLVPVVASLAKQYPNIRITVLSKPFARFMFENLAHNVSFMGADLAKDYKGVLGLNNLFRRLSGKRITAVADCHNVLRTKYLRLKYWFDHIPTAHINKHRKGKKKLTAKKGKKKVQQPTSFQNYADVFATLGYPVNINFNSIFKDSNIKPKELPSNIENLVEKQGLNIGIAPFAAHKEKIYPLEKMNKVIDQLEIEFKNINIYLFGGGEKEKEEIRNIVEQHKCCISVPQNLKGFEQELALMAKLNVMISMDSSNMHLASLVATPVVSIWGATHPFAGFMGWHQPQENAIELGLECRPCSIYGNKPCYRGDFACMENIKPEQIVAQVKNILNAKNGGYTNYR